MTVQQTDEPASTDPAPRPDGPSAAARFFVVALIATVLVVAGLLLFAAFGDMA